MVAEDVTTKDRAVGEIRLRPEAMPSFASPGPVLVFSAPGRLWGAVSKLSDPLAWYAAVDGTDRESPVALRVTRVLCREEAARMVVHRHADPITTPPPQKR